MGLTRVMGMSPACVFCGAPAVARYAMDRGCFCRPDDRVQDLCAQHEYKASPLGSMDLLIDYAGEGT